MLVKKKLETIIHKGHKNKYTLGKFHCFARRKIFLRCLTFDPEYILMSPKSIDIEG